MDSPGHKLRRSLRHLRHEPRSAQSRQCGDELRPAVFALIALDTVLNHSLAGNPALPIIWNLSVAAAAITISWLTRTVYLDLDLYGVEDGFHAGTISISR